MTETFEAIGEIAFEKLVVITYSEETLKRNFEVIAKYLRKLKEGQASLQSELKDVKSELKDTRNELKESQLHNQKEIDSLKKIIDSNQNESREMQKKKGVNEALEKDVAALKEALANYQKEITELKRENSQQSKDISALEKAFADLKESCNTAIIQQMIDSSVSDRLTDLQKRLAELLERLKALEGFNSAREAKEAAKLYQQMQQELLSLQIKLNQINGGINDENEKSELRRLIMNGTQNGNNSSSSSNGNSGDNSSAEKNLADLESRLKSVLKTLNESVNSSLEEKKSAPKKDENTMRMERELTVIQEDTDFLEQANSKTDQQRRPEQRFEARQREINELKRLVNNLDSSKNSNGKNGASQTALDERIAKLRKELLSQIKALKEAMKNKADKDDLLKLEQLLLQKLKEADQLNAEKYANKDETLQALQFLESRINSILSHLKQIQKASMQDDGLVVRRPLWSCIACDSGMKGYNAKQGKHYIWNKLQSQKETSPERAGANFAKGYRAQLEMAKQRYQPKGSPNTMATSNMSADMTPLRRSVDDIHANNFSPFQRSPNNNSLPQVTETLVTTPKLNQRTRANNMSTYN